MAASSAPALDAGLARVTQWARRRRNGLWQKLVVWPSEKRRASAERTNAHPRSTDITPPLPLTSAPPHAYLPHGRSQPSRCAKAFSP
ncbi:hypothetical protein PsYK624_123100 [Phanerochaete sordida]|uniref:Uncharacterized protein n=1 Tax=Phanerochaete sordida TaxID=48140 RepID=A0A9P3LJD8_9APHY|nr:hypothetical protein PsYK624_123100 [Phanerochaete sordida]